MGRWRPPAEKSSPYITPAGFAVLEQEQKDLWLRRRDVVKALAAAAAEGDRSENAEYIYRKKELREIDRRIRYLQKRMPELRVISESPDDIDTVFFAAWVKLRTELVGPDEIDQQKGNISLDSPLAIALLSKQVTDEITIKVQNGRKNYVILAIRY